ncbi:MAG: OmpH family outer membrane protein [Planctomycetota bacterium]|jgi:Skp family chaperone for outer membrane proteins|nr:MAG: OmpH family outer membrane protein [Planctomycetota bacterium]
MKLDSTTIQRLLRIESLAVIVFATALTTYSLTTARRELPPSHVATVDLEKTYNSIIRYSDTQTKLKALAEELDKRVATSELQVKSLEGELDSFQSGSEAQAAAIAKLQASVGEFRAVQQFANAKLELERARALRETYVAIKDAARRFSEREGYDYILLDDSLPEMDPANAAKTMQQISARRFIYANPKSDVTDALIGFMNDDWKAAAGG